MGQWPRPFIVHRCQQWIYFLFSERRETQDRMLKDGRTKTYNRVLQRHLEDTDSSVRQGACGQVSGHNGSLPPTHTGTGAHPQAHKQKA